MSFRQLIRRGLPFILMAPSLFACTTAIISGKATPDGRPLLYKHRDTSKLQNKMMFFTDGRYPYMGLVNAADDTGREVWAGCNSTGFAIMNSATYNQNLADSAEVKDREGLVMKRALQICASLADFEAFLDTLSRPMGLDANFGVIDAQGGAAYYETHQRGYTKFDVNDDATAPHGYLIRTNYAYTGAREEQYGLIRKATVEPLFYETALSGQFTPRFLIQDVSRCLYHSLTRTDLSRDLPEDNSEPDFVFFRDYITRPSSSAAMVIQGVKPGLSAEWSTLWTVLGFPYSAVVMPLFMGGGKTLPALVSADEAGTAPLCRMAMELKQHLFPMTDGSGPNYLNRAAYINREGSGIGQMLAPLENEIFAETRERLGRWMTDDFDARAVHQYYDYLDEKISDYYLEHFNLIN